VATFPVGRNIFLSALLSGIMSLICPFFDKIEKNEMGLSCSAYG